MFKKPIFPLFLSNSHKGNPADRELTDSIVQKIRTLFAALTGEERPHFIGGLLLILVLMLHLWLGLWLLKPRNEPPKTPPMIIMEVSLLAAPAPAPAQKPEITPPAPPVPTPPKVEPPKKQVIKKPVAKKMPVIPKQVELPKPQTVTEEKPPLPSVAPAAPPATPPAVSRPAPAVADSEPKISSGVVPLERIPPKYPARAANRHIEGWVKIEFTITASGTVENAVVVEAQPAEIFDEAALKAINQWTFKEKIVNGIAVEQRAVQTLQFKLTK